MDVRCEKCLTEYEFEDARVTEAGVTVKCTTCGFVFKVKRKSGGDVVVGPPTSASMRAAPAADGPSEMGAPPPAAGGGPREWRIRQASGNVFTCRELTTLQRWIVERKVSRDDEISLTGDVWKRLGNIPELTGFFQVVDQADRANKAAEVDAGAARPRSAPRAEPAWARQDVEPSFEEMQAVAGGSPTTKRVLTVVGIVAVAGLGYVAARLSTPAPPTPVVIQQVPVTTPVPAPKPVETPTPPPVAPVAVAAVDSGAVVAPVDSGAAAPASPADSGPVAAVVDSGVAPTVVDAGQPVVVAPLPAVVDSGRPPLPVADVPPPQLGGSTGPAAPAKARTPEEWVAEGRRLLKAEKAGGAIKAFGSALAAEPRNVDAHLGLGQALIDKEQFQAAEEEFQKALDLQPSLAEAELGMAEALRYQNDKPRALAHYKAYLAKNPSGEGAAIARNAIKQLSE